MPNSELEDIGDVCFKEFSTLIHNMMGITIRPNRRAMLAGRLRSRMRRLGLPSYESYLNYIENTQDEHRSFVNAITTNETYFYRTPRIWNYINDVFLPEWHRENAGKCLSIWSGASSTGEEAYTLGVVMQNFKDQHAGFDYTILGTDIAERVVEQARKGIYKGRAITRFKEAKYQLFERYMQGDDDIGYSVVPDIKSRINFKLFNLFEQDSKQPIHDLVLLRNVLIYFSKKDQEVVMANLYRRLSPRGIAIIGESESLNSMSTNFESILPTIYQPVENTNRQQAA